MWPSARPRRPAPARRRSQRTAAAIIAPSPAPTNRREPTRAAGDRAASAGAAPTAMTSAPATSTRRGPGRAAGGAPAGGRAVGGAAARGARDERGQRGRADREAEDGRGSDEVRQDPQDGAERGVAAHGGSQDGGVVPAHRPRVPADRFGTCRNIT